MIYNVTLVSCVQQSDPVCVCVCVYIYIYIYIYIYTHTHIYIYTHTRTHIYICSFRFFSLIGYYKILSRVPCALQQDLVVYLFYIQ